MRLIAAITALLMLAAAAWADTPMSTANPTQATAPQPEAPQPPLPPAAAASTTSGPQMAMGPCGPEKVKPNGHLDTAAHGEVEAGVGTGGYRHVAGTVCKPIGDNAAVQVSVSETQGSGWRAGRR
jgi:hypothetical protein